MTNRSNSQNKLIKEKIEVIKSLSNEQINNQRFSKLIDIVEAENSLNLVYEKIEGISLVENTTKNQNKTEAEIIKILKHLLESLQIIHDQGFIHQMINPKNMIMTTDDDRIIINNYGKITTDLYSALMATISFEDTRYITQEQLRGKAEISSDIYALGMVLISSIMGINTLNLDENEVGLLNWCEGRDYTDKFKTIIDKMINPKISQRYHDITEVLLNIDQYFPTAIKQNSVRSKSNYTPTEIILPETEREQKQEKTLSAPESNLDATQISLPDSAQEEEPMKPPTNSVNMASTEVILPSEIETVENKTSETNFPPNNDKILADNQYSASIFSDINSTQENNLNSNLVSNSPDNQHPTDNNKLVSKNNKLMVFIDNFIKTPQGILMIVSLILMIIFGVNKYINYVEEKKVEQLITNIKTFYETNEFENCIALINSTETQSLVIANDITQEFLGKCWLGLAELEALNKNFPQAIKTAVQINHKSADYTRARQFIDDWSEELLKEAQIICEKEGDISSASQRLNSIPESSKWKKPALDLIKQCKKRKDSGGVIELCPGPLCPE